MFSFFELCGRAREYVCVVVVMVIVLVSVRVSVLVIVLVIVLVVAFVIAIVLVLVIVAGALDFVGFGGGVSSASNMLRRAEARGVASCRMALLASMCVTFTPRGVPGKTTAAAEPITAAEASVDCEEVALVCARVFL